MKKEDSTQDSAQGILFVCCTSHMDWDWIGTFEDYYSMGLPSSSNPHNPVRYTLDQAFQLLSAGGFQFNLAEIAWLKRWLQDNPDKLAAMAAFGKNLCLMGGGITSPDNLVTHGEVFIRNYLVGHQYLQNIGLADQISNVCWIPDDFGQDPELPVVLKAMGLTGAAFWRVPGDEPGGGFSPKPFGTSIYNQLIENGVAFQWTASDGSPLTALLLADGYGVPFYVSTTDASTTADELNAFVLEPYKWPTANQFVPSGGDFSTPSTNLTDGIADFNTSYASARQITAQLGTFEDYLETLSSTSLTSRTLNPSNFWTGFFASRPQLKVNQSKAARHLLAAETACSMLEVFSQYSRAGLDGIARLIDTGWESLVPSSHHDFITGTAPDNTYWSEQLPLSESALHTAKSAMAECMTRLASTVDAKPQTGELPVVVFNDLGFQRSIGTLVELKGDYALYHSVRIGSDYFPLQHTAGKVLFPCPKMDSMAYTCVYLSTIQHLAPTEAVSIANGANAIVLNNELLTAEISTIPSDKWSITTLIDKSLPGQNLVAQNGKANEVVLYQDSGNLYQFGNEPGCGGFQPEPNSDLVAIGSAKVLETGPYRARFEAQLESKAHGVTYTMEYALHAGEPLVRMSLQGSAPSAPSSNNPSGYSVVTQFPMADTSGSQPSGLSYGTANHWHEMDVVPYWDGPTFRATHDFAVLNGDQGTVGAIYHNGIPAWAFDSGVLMGTLLRNATGTQRGAAGTDTADHRQEYALRLPGVGTPDTCQPLQEAYSVQAAPFAKAVHTAPSSPIVTMAETNQLAAVTQTNALLRVVRTQAGSGSAPTLSQPTYSQNGTPLSIVARIYQPTNDTNQSFSLNLPFGSAQPLIEAEEVTALEATTGTTATPSGTALTIANMPTLATWRIQTTRPYLAANDGKS